VVSRACATMGLSLTLPHAAGLHKIRNGFLEKFVQQLQEPFFISRLLKFASVAMSNRGQISEKLENLLERFTRTLDPHLDMTLFPGLEIDAKLFDLEEETRNGEAISTQ
jgi:hypothetical protein